LKMLCSRSSTLYAVFAFIFVSVLHDAMALQCRNCLSSKSFAECEKMGEVVVCNSTIVNQNHQAFLPDNPTLPQGNWTEFKCYQLQVARLHQNNTDSGLRGYARGCTFLHVNFCNGWTSTLNLTSCSTCTSDNCEQHLPTVAPELTTTTTTKKPSSSGANVLTWRNLSSLGFLSAVVLLLTAR
uniref:Salivary secreted peptide n=1 Tax=Anopheles coluzzii TaxID=1518534 RepID=A0A8W7PWA4_ANOCL